MAMLMHLTIIQVQLILRMNIWLRTSGRSSRREGQKTLDDSGSSLLPVIAESKRRADQDQYEQFDHRIDLHDKSSQNKQLLYGSHVSFDGSYGFATDLPKNKIFAFQKKLLYQEENRASPEEDQSVNQLQINYQMKKVVNEKMKSVVNLPSSLRRSSLGRSSSGRNNTNKAVKFNLSNITSDKSIYPSMEEDDDEDQIQNQENLHEEKDYLQEYYDNKGQKSSRQSIKYSKSVIQNNIYRQRYQISKQQNNQFGSQDNEFGQENNEFRQQRQYQQCLNIKYQGEDQDLEEQQLSRDHDDSYSFNKVSAWREIKMEKMHGKGQEQGQFYVDVFNSSKNRHQRSNTTNEDKSNSRIRQSGGSNSRIQSSGRNRKQQSHNEIIDLRMKMIEGSDLRMKMMEGQLAKDKNSSNNKSKMFENLIVEGILSSKRSTNEHHDTIKSSNNNLRNSLVKTTGRKHDLREHVISLIQYCSNQVGLAIYNTTNGEIYLAQIIERLTYFRTISTIQRYYPLDIIYSVTLENTPLIKKLMDKFKNTNFRPFKRISFDQTKGYQIYVQRGNKEEYNPDNKFVAYSALNALLVALENSYSSKFTYSALKIKWHLLEQILVIESQTISDLQIFLNGETKKSANSFVQNFSCFTYGGTRMLRANLLQPLANIKLITERQNMVEILKNNKLLMDMLSKELIKFRMYEPITAKFIQSPREHNYKSLKGFIEAIYSLSHLCLLLGKFSQKIEPFAKKQAKIPMIQKIYKLVTHQKINELKMSIEANFEEEILKNYEENKGKKQNFMFLFKTDKLEDEFAEITRMTYSHTIEQVIKMYNIIKSKSNKEIKLVYNQFRGYFLRVSGKKKINLVQLSYAIQDDIIQQQVKQGNQTFCTSMMLSLNNRLRESEKNLVYQSENLLKTIITEIQQNIDILFDINYQLSTLDMIMSFVGFIHKYNMVPFTRPLFNEPDNAGFIKIQGMKSVWTNQRIFKISDNFNFNADMTNSVIIYQKQVNSFQQLNILYSMGYLVILSQVGCFVPATTFITDLYDTLISKVIVKESTEIKLSHFQLEILNFKNILQNSISSNNRTLILIDELVKGTQYEEEIALSLAIVDFLQNIKGKSFVLISDDYIIKTIDRIFNQQFENDSSAKKRLISEHESPNNVLINRIKRSHQSVQEILVELNYDEQFIRDFQNLQIYKK